MLYLGAASGTTVSHVSDVVGPEGMVYAVEFSHRFVMFIMFVAMSLMMFVMTVMTVTLIMTSQVGPRPAEHGEEEDERGADHRGREAPPQVPHARPHGRLRLR